MMRERTLTIVKPDAVRAGNLGNIIAMLESGGFAIVDLKWIRMDGARAEGFYAVHRERPFFSSLIEFMTSGPIVALVLEADNAISVLREAMGATDPAKAAKGSIRKKYGSSIEKNAIHGSDSTASAETEIGYLFPGVSFRPE
jgi:nucleoside-diphosphate kinase